MTPNMFHFVTERQQTNKKQSKRQLHTVYFPADCTEVGSRCGVFPHRVSEPVWAVWLLNFDETKRSVWNPFNTGLDRLCQQNSVAQSQTKYS